MKVSIIVPVYNVFDYLGECLDSLVGQTMAKDEYEIVLVNDGSTDGSGDICRSYAENYPENNIIIIDQENAGQSAARNRGMLSASGEYVLFVDSDDYIATDACEMLYSAAVHSGADVVVADMLNERQRLLAEPDFRNIPGADYPIPLVQFAKAALDVRAYDIVPCIRLVKRAFIDSASLSFMEGVYYEDQEYSLRLFTSSGTAVKIRYPFYFYRMQRPGSTTTFITPKKSYDLTRVIEKMLVDPSLASAEGREVALRIIGISLYHYVSVWVRLPKDARKSHRREFLARVMSSSDATLALQTLRGVLRKRVNDFLNHPSRIMFREWIRRILGRR